MFVTDVKIIDKKYSSLDDKRSDPAKGKYAWTKKEYIDLKRHIDKDKEWFFTTSHYDPRNGFLDFYGDKVQYGYVPIEKEDRFIPEGAMLNTEGYWQFKDVVFCKVPLREHLIRRQNDMKISKNAAKNMVKELHQQFKDEGCAISDEEIDSMMGEDIDVKTIKARSQKKII